MEGLAIRAIHARIGRVHPNDTKAPRRNKCYHDGAALMPAGAARTRRLSVTARLDSERATKPAGKRLSQDGAFNSCAEPGGQFAHLRAKGLGLAHVASPLISTPLQRGADPLAVPGGPGWNTISRKISGEPIQASRPLWKVHGVAAVMARVAIPLHSGLDGRLCGPQWHTSEGCFARPMCDVLSQWAPSTGNEGFFGLDHGFHGRAQARKPSSGRPPTYLSGRFGPKDRAFRALRPNRLRTNSDGRRVLSTRPWGQRHRTLDAARGWHCWSTLTRDGRFLTVFVQFTLGIEGFWRFGDWPPECCHVSDRLWGETHPVPNQTPVADFYTAISPGALTR
jgi:hypothetical protein